MHAHTEAPAAYLAGQLALISGAPAKTALDIACGKGRNALFLAQNGFTVTGLELNAEAIASVRQSAERARLPVTVVPIDLEAPGTVLPSATYGVVTVFYYLHRPLFPFIRASVAPGGFVVYETFLIDQHERWGSPKRREFALAHNELLHAFSDFRIHHYAEIVNPERQSATAQIVAQKPA